MGEGVDTGEGLILQRGSCSPHPGSLLVPTRSQHSVKEVLKLQQSPKGLFVFVFCVYLCEDFAT